jgi:hypothetical protein
MQKATNSIASLSQRNLGPHLKPEFRFALTTTEWRTSPPETSEVVAFLHPRNSLVALRIFETQLVLVDWLDEPKHPPGLPMTVGNMREVGDNDGYAV